MKVTIDIDIDNIILDMNSSERVATVKRLAGEVLDVEEMVEAAHAVGYEDEDILECLDWDKTTAFVHAGE